jgi:hypothetical protein
MLSLSVGYAPPRLCSFPRWGFDDNGAALAIAFSFAPYFFSLSWSSARSRALVSCLRSWEASQRLRAHDRVGDNDCRFLRQVVEERVGKQKTPNPRKMRNKSIKQNKKRKGE